MFKVNKCREHLVKYSDMIEQTVLSRMNTALFVIQLACLYSYQINNLSNDSQILGQKRCGVIVSDS